MEQKITIDESLSLDKKEETLLHEIIEALSGYYSLNLEHDVITTLGFGLLSVEGQQAIFEPPGAW